MYNVELSYKDVVLFTAGPVDKFSTAEQLLIACVNKCSIADSATIIDTMSSAQRHLSDRWDGSQPALNALTDDVKTCTHHPV